MTAVQNSRLCIQRGQCVAGVRCQRSGWAGVAGSVGAGASGAGSLPNGSAPGAGSDGVAKGSDQQVLCWSVERISWRLREAHQLAFGSCHGRLLSSFGGIQQ